MCKANIADEPSIPNLLELLQETMRRIEVLNESSEDRGLIELKRHIMLAIAELSTQQPYPVSLPGIVPLTNYEQKVENRRPRTEVPDRHSRGLGFLCWRRRLVAGNG